MPITVASSFAAAPGTPPTKPSTSTAAPEATRQTTSGEVQLATFSPMQGLPFPGTVRKGTDKSRTTSAQVQLARSSGAHSSRTEFLAYMQQRYEEQELHKFDEIPAEKMNDAKKLHVAYQELAEALDRDAASVKAEHIDRVMTMAEKYFGVDWKKDTRLSGFMYQWVSHPVAAWGVLGPALFSHDKYVPRRWVLAGFVTQLHYTITAFMALAAIHSVVFQMQFRVARHSAKTTSDSVKTPTLAAALQKLQEATAEFERSPNGAPASQPAAALQEFQEAADNFERSAMTCTAPSDQDAMRPYSNAYQKLLNARANCAKVEGKFNIEQKALFHTTQVRSARAVIGAVSTILGLLSGNARNGLMFYAGGTAVTMLAQIFAGLPDTANKASAQNRLMPRAVDVLGAAARERERRATASARGEAPADNPAATNADPDVILPVTNGKDGTPGTRLQAGSHADAHGVDEELSIFISTLYKSSLLGRFGMRVNLLEKRFDYEKRVAMQEISRLYGMPDPDSYQRMTYLAGRPDELSDQECAELAALEQAFSRALSPAKQEKFDVCRHTVERLDKDIANLKQPNWNALSEPGKTALEKELKALVELEKYRNITDVHRLIPTLLRALSDALTDLMKPEQVTPLAINKCVQVFTMGLGGPAIPQLVGAGLAAAKSFLSHDAPGYALPKWLVVIPIVVFLFSLYGSRFGPRAATHTVQLRSDLKNKQAEGQLGIPANPGMYLSPRFWKLFLKDELPGSVVAQYNIDRGRSKLLAEYKKSEQLMTTNQEIMNIQATDDAETGQSTVLNVNHSA